ncbi:MAG: trimethylamine methyltransferase family protein [Spirochaetaceae bacterium]|nr:MAG: trimethylamine methyltransferase family protein [Spirochaetaceae bacterium]
MNGTFYLDDDQIGKIDAAARALLQEPGILLEDEQIYSLVLKSGAKPGAKPLVARLPSALIDDCLARAPREVRFADRRGGLQVVGPDSPSRFWTGAALFYLDKRGFRSIRQQDLADFARIIDALEQVDVIVGTSTEETPPHQRDFVGFRIMAQNTSKHLRALSFSPRGGEAMIEMARVLAGGGSLKQAPLFSMGFTAHGPLRWTALALGVYRMTAGHGIPVTVNGEPMAGASAPVTLAGAAVVGTAEILAGILVNQLLEPGRPCLFNLGFAHVMDMRQGFAVTGGPENVLLAVTGAQLARHYGLPSVSWMCTDSLHYDAQNALEKMLAAVTHTQAGVSTIWGVGQVESEKTISPVQAVIDDEIIAAVRRYLRGFSTDEESLAVEEVRRVGICGSFLDSDHTFAHFRGEVFLPELLVRAQRMSAGERADLVSRAEDRVDAILTAGHKPVLDEASERELLSIEKRYASGS